MSTSELLLPLDIHFLFRGGSFSMIEQDTAEEDTPRARGRRSRRMRKTGRNNKVAVVMPRLFICFTIVGLLMGPSQGHRSTFPTTSLLKQPEGARVLNLRGGGGRRRSGAQSSGYSMNKVESAVSHLGRNPSTCPESPFLSLPLF